jgi:hypothetical protein
MSTAPGVSAMTVARRRRQRCLTGRLDVQRLPRRPARCRALKAADIDDRIRSAMMMYQALIEAELSSVIGGRAARARRHSDDAA